MNWDSLAAFVSMGGHGLYVWGSFALVAVVLGLEGLVERALRPPAAASATGADRSQP